MPYRRLPNTDTARLKALRAAFMKGKELPPFELAFSQSTFQKIGSFLPGFENVISQHRMAYSSQVKRSKEYQVCLKKARMYVSHFIQVVNMSILRGELPKNTKAFFHLDDDSRRLPPLNSETDLIRWGDTIIKGEAQRMMKGLAPITNPTIAVVKVRYETFMDAYLSQKTLQKSSERTLEELIQLRKQADTIITEVWNEVEATFAGAPEDIKRNKAEEYGVSYVYRKNEIASLSIPVLRDAQLSFI